MAKIENKAQVLHLHGTILGVPFDVAVRPGASTVDITGYAGGQLLNISAIFDDLNDSLSVRGTLMGHEVKIEGAPAVA